MVQLEHHALSHLRDYNPNTKLMKIDQMKKEITQYFLNVAPLTLICFFSNRERYCSFNHLSFQGKNSLNKIEPLKTLFK